MELLSEKFNNLSVSEASSSDEVSKASEATGTVGTGTKQSAQTGVLFDFEQLKHKSSRQHVECPARVQSIFSHLTDTELLKSASVEVVDSLREGDRAIVEYVHDENYIDFIEGMWPEGTKKSEIYLLDTYFNESSKRAAYLGVGGIVEAVDRIVAKTWKNAFCLFRPPGHHSGHAKVCTGFCFFNNVAIAARYLQRNHAHKKILIFDWDIHHGDGTQNIFKDDPSVLVISLHRHDDGKFYPTTGSVSNQGEGEGKGYSVNIPWDIAYSDDAQKAGTDEYIYAFERIAAPIIESFKPDFVLVSAGFDSAEGDPLGQCKLTYEGYAYMTRRLMDMMGEKNILVVLEGGYNLESISWAAESVLRTLIGEPFPLKKDKRQQSLEKLRDNIIPNSVGFAAVKKSIQAYKAYWPCLGEFGNAYDELLTKNVRKVSLISAGHEKNFLIRDNVILKKCKKNELDFYRDLQNPSSASKEQNEKLRRFTPELRGFEVIESGEYVVLQNLTFGREKGSIIDFKLGKNTLHASYSEDKMRTVEKKDLKTTSNSHGYRISGVIIKNEMGIPSETIQSGNFLSGFKHNDVIEYTKKVFASNSSNSMNLTALTEFVSFLEDLLHFFTQENTRSFVSTSIIVIIDNIAKSHVFKLIDFNYVDPLPENLQRDENVILGIESILDFSKVLLKAEQDKHNLNHTTSAVVAADV